MKSKGTVLRLDGDYAIVGVKRHTACDTCRAECGGHCDKAATVETKVKNILNAKVGDRVVLYTETSAVLGFASVVFLLPLILALIGYLVPLFLNLNSKISIILSVLFFFLSFLIVYLVWGKKEVNEKIVMSEIEVKND